MDPRRSPRARRLSRFEPRTPFVASLAAVIVALALGCSLGASRSGSLALAAPSLAPAPPTASAEPPAATAAAEIAPVSAQPPASIPDETPAALEPEVVAESAADEVILWQPRSLLTARRVLAAKAPHLSNEEREDVAHELATLEQEYGFDVLLVLALITQESRFDPAAVGPKGSLGLMQVRPWVGQDVAGRYGIPWDGAGTLFDPARNVAIGTRYFVEMVEMFDRDDYALAAYNMGPYRLRRVLRRGGTLEVDYVKRVYQHYDALIEGYGSTASGWGG